MVLKTPQFIRFPRNIFQVRYEFSQPTSKLVAQSSILKQGGVLILSEDGGRADFTKKPSAPLSLVTTYPMSLISAGYNLLDSTFNHMNRSELWEWLADRVGPHHLRLNSKRNMVCGHYCWDWLMPPRVDSEFSFLPPIILTKKGKRWEGLGLRCWLDTYLSVC